MIYKGVLNILNGDTLLKVIDFWKCKNCGATRVSIRGLGITSSDEGNLGVLDPSEEKRWILIVNRGEVSVSPDVIIVPAKPGDTIKIDAYREFIIDSSYRLLVKKELIVPKDVTSYLLENVVNGYIDISTWPPTVFTLKAQLE